MKCGPTFHCAPGFIIPSIYGYKRSLHVHRTGSVKIWKTLHKISVHGYTDIFTVCAKHIRSCCKLQSYYSYIITENVADLILFFVVRVGSLEVDQDPGSLNSLTGL